MLSIPATKGFEIGSGFDCVTMNGSSHNDRWVTTDDGIGTETNNIIKETNLLLNDKDEFDKMAKAINPYGDGYASEKIVNLCLKFLDTKN